MQITGNGDILEGVSSDGDLILGGSTVDGDTVGHVDTAHNLLTDEVTDLNGLLGVGDGRIDGEMGVYQLHLVLESLNYNPQFRTSCKN